MKTKQKITTLGPLFRTNYSVYALPKGLGQMSTTTTTATTTNTSLSTTTTTSTTISTTAS